MNQVAREARLAKGTLYLYYDTKEELFLALLVNHMQDWFDEIGTRLRGHPPRSPDDLTSLLLEVTEQQVALRRLMTLLNGVLNRNVKPEVTQQFRMLVYRHIQELSAHLGLDPGVTFRVLSHLYALTIGWHYVSEPGSVMYQEQLSDSLPYRRPQFAQEVGLALRPVVRHLLEGHWPPEPNTPDV